LTKKYIFIIYCKNYTYNPFIGTCKIGDLKDKLFFIPYEDDIENNHNVIKITNNAFGLFIGGYSFDYIHNESQFMSSIINYYKELINK
jgi:hypothetical protein